MKICVVSTGVFVHPPSGYSGLEMISWHAAKGLAAKGHQVSLIAPEGSWCPGVNVFAVGPPGQWDEKKQYGTYWPHLLEVDAIIDMSWQKWSYALKQEGKLKVPILGVLHAPVDSMFKSLPAGIDKPCFVCISDDQRAHFEGLFSRPARTCYNGCFEFSTMVYPEGKSPERLGDFVKRGGRDRVLAWDAVAQILTYTEVRETLELDPTNTYAVEIKVSDSELILISTPDNPIMTRGGWKAACLITCQDEVLCGQCDMAKGQEGRIVDGSREGLCEKELWKSKIEDNVSRVRETGIVYKQYSDSIGNGEDTASFEVNVEQVGQGFATGEVSYFVGERVGQTVSEVYSKWHSGASKEDEVKKETFCLLPENHIREAAGHSASSSSILGGNHRRGRVCHIQTGQEKIHTGSGCRDSEQRSKNYSICQRLVASNGLVGESEAERTERCASEKTCLESNCNRVVGREGFGEDSPIHDSQESPCGGGDGVLQDCLEWRMAETVHQEATQTVCPSEERKFSVWKKVAFVRRVPTPTRVYDLQTRAGNFLANGIIVHNCDSETFYKPLGLPRTKRFLFLGRFSSVKSPDTAIEACKRAGVGLDLVGDTSITNEPELLAKCKAMADGEQIRMVGPCTRAETVYWFSRAHCMIHPVKNFREPFGLAPVESLACGTPVIAWNHGAMRETVKDNKMGWLVNSFEDLVGCIHAAMQTNGSGPLVPITEETRGNCRKWVIENFSIQRMVDRYDELVMETVQTGGW